MFFKRNNKNNKKVELVVKHYTSVSELYLDNVCYYVDYLGNLVGKSKASDDIDFFNEHSKGFYQAAMYIVDYMKDRYPDSMLCGDDVIDFDIEALTKDMPSSVATFFNHPTISDVVYIDDSKYFTHFHVRNNIVEEAEGVNELPGLSRILANKKINTLFENLSLVEVRALLNQMGILPKETELDRVLEDLNQREIIRDKFLSSVICLITLDRIKYAFKRARLFADSLGIPFKFEDFEPIDTMTKVKE